MFGQVLFILLLIATLGILLAGLVLMGIGGKLNEKYANRLMSLRVLFQALAIIVLVLLFSVAGK